MNFSRLRGDIREDILSNMGLENAPLEEQQKAIEALSANEAFEKFCDWHGLINWGARLSDTLENIQKAWK